MNAIEEVLAQLRSLETYSFQVSVSELWLMQTYPSYRYCINVKRSINMIMTLLFVPLQGVVYIFLSLQSITVNYLRVHNGILRRDRRLSKSAQGRRCAVPLRFLPYWWLVYQWLVLV